MGQIFSPPWVPIPSLGSLGPVGPFSSPEPRLAFGPPPPRCVFITGNGYGAHTSLQVDQLRNLMILRIHIPNFLPVASGSVRGQSGSRGYLMRQFMVLKVLLSLLETQLPTRLAITLNACLLV